MLRCSTPALFASLWLVAVAACGEPTSLAPDSGGADAGVDPDATAALPDAGPSYADGDWLYEPERLLTIDIEITPADWDRLRFQSRSILSIFGEACGLQPAYSPFTHVPATVTIEGQRVEEVGLRKKGFLGSLDEVKPSLKISFDEYRPGQTLSGLERMTLNNAKQDPSYLDQCLGYQLFQQAGVPAPRCNYARVSVNGEPLGLYVHVEPIKKPFLARHFASDDGNLYEGTLSDFRAGWTGTFEPKTNLSDPPGSEDRSDLEAIVAALDLDDAEMLAQLEQRIDLEGFYSFWAIETMTSHWDGYAGNTNNYYLYRDPDSGRFTFLPWGTDQLFGEAGPDPGLTRGALTRRLYLYGPSRARYLARYQEILDQIWDDDALLAEITRVATLVSSTILVTESQQFSDSLAQLRSAITGREARLRDRLAVAGPGDADPLSEPMCFDSVGSIESTFTVPWGATSEQVTFEVTVDGVAVPLANLAAYAGPSDEVEGQAVLYLVGETTGNRTVVAYVAMPDTLVAPGTIEVGTDQIESVLLVFVEGVEEAEAIYFSSGTMLLETAGLSPGSPWQGSLDLTLWSPPWL